MPPFTLFAEEDDEDEDEEDDVDEVEDDDDGTLFELLRPLVLGVLANR